MYNVITNSLYIHVPPTNSIIIMDHGNESFYTHAHAHIVADGRG